MSDLKGLQARLRHISAEYEDTRRRAKADELPVSVSVKRLALRNTLGAVIAHLKAQPNFDTGDIALLVKLGMALLDAENGVGTDYMLPTQRQGAPPDITNVKLIKGRLAAEVELLFRASKPPAGRRKETRLQTAARLERACKAVFKDMRKGGSLFRTKREAPTWKTVKRWHRNIPRMPLDSIERRAYEAHLAKGE
jgi:hypothetical protein